eukprot:1161647-Pelagomonas_calceolata.AAC.9
MAELTDTQQVRAAMGESKIKPSSNGYIEFGEFKQLLEAVGAMQTCPHKDNNTHRDTWAWAYRFMTAH